MKKEADLITYDVREIDLFKLKSELEQISPKRLAVYGIGKNGIKTYKLLKSMNLKVDSFVDVKACEGLNSFKDHQVISPQEFVDRYSGEYIIITPSIYDSILQWLINKNIPREKILLCFYVTEKITVDYGKRYINGCSSDIAWCKEKPKDIIGTFVTIAYNTPENLFRRAIESVINQTETRFKYLIIINGATDRSYDVAMEYAANDSRIQVVNLEENLRWTNAKLLTTIRDNVEGKFCCQLDSDDYYTKDFLEESFEIAKKNEADIVCVRTCLFSEDSEYSPLNEGLVYDSHDKFFMNVVHPHCHFIGHKNIMKAYAESKICSTFWGKLYSNDIMNKYLDYLLNLQEEYRELYYRLDISMTYRILSMSERVFYSDKVLHYSQYSKKNSTFTLAPIEWLMALWYAYRGFKEDLSFLCGKKESEKCLKAFLKIHLPWMVGRKGMLNDPTLWANKQAILENFKEMVNDKHFKAVLEERKFRNDECIYFYNRMVSIIQEDSK